MRQHCQVLLLLAVLLLAEVESVPATTSLRLTKSDTSTFARSRIAEENGAPTVQRLLRTVNMLSETNEEKAISIKPIAALDKFKAGVEKITSAFKSKTTLETLLGWAKENKPAGSVFVKLKLDKAKTLADNPNFMVWVAYARYVWADYANPDTVIINFLMQKYGDMNLARLLDAATQTKGTEKIATTLQNAQFERWRILGVDPWEKFGLSIGTLFTNEDVASRAIWAKYVVYQAKVKRLQAAENVKP